MNGYGERCGNANLTSIIPGLKLKMGLPVVTDEQLERLTETAHFVAEVVNVTPWAHQPYVGRSAFTHKGGLHVAAVEAAPQTFEHIDPRCVGNEQRVLISELSGKGAVLRKARELGFAARPATTSASGASCGASSRRSTRASTTRRPTPRSTSSCTTSSAGTGRCFASRASA